MADFNGIPLDKDVEEANGEFTVLPAGKYKACIVSDELKDNKANTGKILVLKIQVTEGQYASELLTDNINITNPSQVAQAIGQGTLKRICNLCQVPYPPQNTSGLMGKPMVVTVNVEEFLSNTSGKKLQSNNIKKYEPGNTQIPAITPQATSQTHPQGQPQQHASGW